MSEQVKGANKVIHDVVTLDLRTTSAETFATIKHIQDVVTILYSEETAPQIARLTLQDVVVMFEVPGHAAILSGQTTLNHSSFQNQGSTVFWVISGQLFIDPALSVEELDQRVEGLIVSGQVLCPERLSGVVQSKLKHVSGQFLVYPDNAQLVLGKLVLTEPYLRQMPDKSSLVVLGKFVATQPLPPELLAQKIDQLQVYGKVLCAEENSILVRALQAKPVFGDASFVPSGFEVVERPLVLDAGLLETFSARKLYCTGLVQFDNDVTPELVESAIDKIVVNHLLIAPVHLRKVLAQKCDLLTTKAIFYTGGLWLVEGEAKLDPARFGALEGQATLVVTGSATIDPAIDPGVLVARLHRVHNLGEIRGTATQLATLQARVGTNEGEWIEPFANTESTESNTNESRIGDIVYLKL